MQTLRKGWRSECLDKDAEATTCVKKLPGALKVLVKPLSFSLPQFPYTEVE